jgi:hypothetical protein
MFVYLVAILFSLPAFAAIYETAHFSQVSSHMTDETWLLLDIDETLVVPAQMAGSDLWFEHRQEEHKKKMSSSEASEKVVAEWVAIRHLSEMEIVEPGIDRIIASLQNNGSPVMALTAQEFTTANVTPAQLRKKGIDLSLTTPIDEGCYFEAGGRGVLYRRGICYCSNGKTKAEVFFLLCEKFGVFPERIVFVDDKLGHLKRMEIEAEKRGIEFVGLRYGYADARKKAFHYDAAKLQFAPFEKILSDDEALRTLSQ